MKPNIKRMTSLMKRKKEALKELKAIDKKLFPHLRKREKLVKLIRKKLK